MLFNSFHFLAFFPIVVALYFAIPPRFRWMLLLAASYYFYGCWRADYLSLLMLSTAVDYYCAVQMGKEPQQGRRRKFLVASCMTNLGMLVIFKYFNFFAGTLNAVSDRMNVFYHLPELKVLLPVGISFYVFQSLSYTIDVYRGKLEPERHLGRFAVYVAFFPQLVAGPIERPDRLLPQFRETHRFSGDNLRAGGHLMLWGFLKKVAVADRLALYVNPVYANPAGYDALALVLATYCFAIQIYCDFSGYSDIAKGAARVMGYDLMTNFDHPYFSQSIREFWQRWHISLSTWFRDYLYVPLGGNRQHRYRNLMITFLVSGLWHGANWTFVVWGGLHGVYLVTALATTELRARLVRSLGLGNYPGALSTLRVLTTFHLVTFSWIFFRANHLSDAWLILTRIGGAVAELSSRKLWLPAPFQTASDMLFLLVMLLVMAAAHQMRFRNMGWPSVPMVRSAAVAVQFWFIVVFGVFDNRQFIYFQF